MASHRASNDFARANALGELTIQDPGASGTFDLQGNWWSRVTVTATGNYTLPAADSGTTLIVDCDDTSVVTLKNAAGTTVGVFTGTTGTTSMLCIANGRSSWSTKKIDASTSATGDITAAEVSIADAGSVIASSTVEAALAEIFTRTAPTSKGANTAITTVGAETLSAAGIVGGVITRSGSTAAYQDTTATGTQIVTALGTGITVGATWLLQIRNTVAFAQTVAAGADTTVTGNTIVPPNSVGMFWCKYSDVNTVDFVGIGSHPLTSAPLSAVTTDSTAGNRTLTAAGIVGGVYVRSGSVAAYNDTTDTAANIIAALPNASIGYGFEFTIKNTVAFAETVIGGTGVNAGATIAILPGNTIGQFHAKYASAGVVTVTVLSIVPQCPLPPAQFTTDAAGSATETAGWFTGAAHVIFRNTNDAATTITTRTATQWFAAIPNAHIGLTWILTLEQEGDDTLTLGVGSGVTNPLTTTLTVATKTTRSFYVTFTSATAATVTGYTKGTIE